MMWGADNKSLFVAYRNRWATNPPSNDISMSVYRYDLSTGKKELWKRIAPGDPTGVQRVQMVLLAPGTNAYCYPYPYGTPAICFSFKD